MTKLSSIIGVIFLCMMYYTTIGQNLYDPSANAEKQISETVSKAKQQNKHVLVQVGGNWCGWCKKLHEFIKNDATIDSLIQSDYITVHINYSKENKNEKVLKNLGNPQRFGFPVLLVLNQDGKRIHTQDTVFLEEGKGYNRKKLLRFLRLWNVEAVKI